MWELIHALEAAEATQECAVHDPYVAAESCDNGEPDNRAAPAGRDPNTHINSISYSQALGQERVRAKGGGRHGQTRTSDTMAVNWGKRARRGKGKRTYKRIKRATDRMRFWYPRQCRAMLRYDGLCFLMYSLACIYTLMQVNQCAQLDRSCDIRGRVPKATLCSMLPAYPLMNYTWQLIQQRKGTQWTTAPPSSTTHFFRGRLGPKSQRSTCSCKTCTNTSRLCWNMLYILLAGSLALTRGAPEVRLLSILIDRSLFSSKQVCVKIFKEKDFHAFQSHRSCNEVHFLQSVHVHRT